MQKKYKTWELMKMACEFQYGSEFPEKRPHFRNLKTGRIVTFIRACDGVGLGAESLEYTNTANSDWELVQQPVSFMEAVKAYGEGKTIFCNIHIDDIEFIYKYKPGRQNSTNTIHGFTLQADNGNVSITTNEILDGTWYIEEAE